MIRICADSPLIDWRLIDRMINLSKNLVDYDIISNVNVRTFPKGQSVEIIEPKIFGIPSKSLSLSQKEHVTKFFYDRKNYKIFNFKSKKNYKNYNLCVDNYNDYLLVLKLIKKKGIFAPWKNYVEEL